MFLSIIVLITACSSRETGIPHSFLIYEENGVTIAKTIGRPKYQEELFKYEEVLRLKQDARQPASLLSQPRSFIMDEAHAIYLVDNYSDRIVCFHPDGSYSHDIGRRGEGPGEFQNVNIMSISDGIVTVFDMRLYRTSLFRTDGTFIESISIPRNRFFMVGFHLGPNGEKILLGQKDEMGRDTYRYSTAIVHLLSAENDTIATLTTERVKLSYDFFIEEYRTGGLAWIYFSGWPMSKYHKENGIYLTTGHDPSISIYSLSGLLKRVILIDIPPKPVADAERRAVQSYYEQRMQNATDDRYREIAKQQLEHMEFCDPKSYWLGIHVEENGYIWASWPEHFWLYALGDLHEPTFRLIDPDGVYLGDTKHPIEYGAITRGHVIAKLDNEDTGEIDIVVYRIIPAVEGLKYP
jgi:hypothetical protein